MSPKFLTLTEVLEFHEDLEAATKEVASGKLDKDSAAAILEKIYNEYKAA